MTESRGKDIRSKLLSKMEQDPNITLQKVMEEAQRIVNLKHDNTKIEEKVISYISHMEEV